MRCRKHHHVACALGSLLVAHIAGCRFAEHREPPPEPDGPEIKLSASVRQSLEDDLDDVLEFAEQAIVRITHQIESETDDRAIRRAALSWKLDLLADMQQEANTKEPLRALVDTWALAVRVAEYVQAGAGRDLFGKWQPQARAVAADVLREFERLGRAYLPAKSQPQIVRQIHAYARQHPIRGLFDHEAVRDFGEADEGRSLIQRLLAAPMRAVGTVGGGLDPTARLARAVDRFTELMQDYPALVRWQLQLALLDVDQMPSVTNVVTSLRQAAEAASAFNQTAAALPQRLRTESQQLLEDFDARQPELRHTLNEARDTIAAANDTLKQAQPVAESIRTTTTELVRAGQAWSETAAAVEATLDQLHKLKPPREAEAGDAPQFDIKDYTRTAEALRAATVELRALLSDLDRFAESPALDRTATRAHTIAGNVLTETDTRLRSVIDHAFWRALQLALLVVVVVVTSQLLLRRNATPSRENTART